MRRLLIRPGAIGDVILSLPALEAARADYAAAGTGPARSSGQSGSLALPPAPGSVVPASYVEVWAPRPVLPLIRFADRTRAIIDTGIELLGVLEQARVPALDTFDSIYSWYGTNRPEFRQAVKHLPFTFFPALPPSSEGIPRIATPARPLEDFAVIHPFASAKSKRWPMEHFRAVAASLGVPVKWTAGPEEALDDAERFDDLYELACWLASARIYIGNDSGIAHLAAAAGTPVIAIFLSTDPRVWAPRGSHVTVLENPSIEEVAVAARRSLRPLNLDRKT